MAISIEDLLFGGAQTYAVAIPRRILAPGGDEADNGASATVTIRPLRLVEVQRVQKAAQESEALTSVLMVQQALVEPKVTLDEVQRMHVGLVEFLLREINRISGLSLSTAEIHTAVQAPLARACFVLARELGWTPDECANLTLGQILLYVEMLGRDERPTGRPADRPGSSA